jgi:hypothetical protein
MLFLFLIFVIVIVIIHPFLVFLYGGKVGW